MKKTSITIGLVICILVILTANLTFFISERGRFYSQPVLSCILLVALAIVVVIFISRSIIIARNNYEETNQNTNIIENFSAGYASTYLLNLVSGNYRILTRSADISAKYPESLSFWESFELYVMQDVYEEDKNKLLETMRRGNLINAFAESNKFEIEYRDISSGLPRWYVMRAFKMNDVSDVLIGFADRHEKILRKHADDKKQQDYISRYIIDLENDTYFALKRPTTTTALSRAKDEKWSSVTTEFIKEVTVDSQEVIKLMGDINLIKSELRYSESKEYVYRLSSNLRQWRRAIMTKIETKGKEPVKADLTIVRMDENAGEKEEMRIRLADQNKQMKRTLDFIGGLASQYSALYLIDLDTDECTTFEHVDKEFPDSDNVPGSCKFFSEGIRRWAEEFVHPDDLDKLLEYSGPGYVRKALLHKKTDSLRFRYMLDGEYRWVEQDIIKVADDEDSPETVILALKNVNEEVLLEEERQRAVKESLEKDKMAEHERYNFMVNVAHELRTPLTLIIGPLRRFIRTETLSEKGTTTIKNVCCQAEKMTTLLNTVLASNNMEDGVGRIAIEPIQFNEWAKAVAAEFQDEVERRAMKMETVCDPAIGVVRMDTHLTRIIYSNLIVNALRHNDEGNSITITTRWNDTKDGVRLSVSDCGPGIGDVDESKLFERYYRATEEKTGFGIGLSFSKKIVESLNGKIGAYNNENAPGATFWFEIPADYDYRMVPTAPQVEEL